MELEQLIRAINENACVLTLLFFLGVLLFIAAVGFLQRPKEGQARDNG